MILSTFLIAIGQILRVLINAYTIVIIVSCLLSFVNPDPYNRLVQIIYRLTEPVFRFVRRFIPTNFGGLDFAPLIILLALQFIDQFFITLIFRYAV